MSFDKNNDAILINGQGSHIRALDDQIIYRDTINRFGTVATNVSIDYNWNNDVFTINGYFIVEGFFVHFDNYQGGLNRSQKSKGCIKLKIANGVYRDILSRQREPWIGEELLLADYPNDWNNGIDQRQLHKVNDTDYTPEYICPLFYYTSDLMSKKITIHCNWTNPANEAISTSGDINLASYINREYSTNNIPNQIVRVNEKTLLNTSLDNETKGYKQLMYDPFDDNKATTYHQFLNKAFDYTFKGSDNLDNQFETYRNPANGSTADTKAHNQLNVNLWGYDVNGTKHFLTQFNVNMYGLLQHLNQEVHYSLPIVYGDKQPLMYLDFVFEAVDDTTNDRQIVFNVKYSVYNQIFADITNFDDATKVKFEIEGEWI